MEEFDLVDGPEAKIPTKLVSRPRKTIDFQVPQILDAPAGAPLFVVGSYAVSRGLVRAPGAWLVEAHDAQKNPVLLQLAHVRPVESAADRLTRTHFEQRILSQTAGLLSERDLVILSHGGVDRADGTRVLFWALPFPEHALRLREPLKHIESLDHLLRVGASMAARLAHRHAIDRTDPLLSEHLILVTAESAELIGAPVHLPDEWLAADMPCPRRAPEEVTGAGTPTKLGDIWRLGQALSALACAFEPLPEPVRELFDRLTASDPKKRMPRSSEALVELEEARRTAGDASPSLGACTVAMTRALSEDALSELIVRSMGDSTRLEAFAVPGTESVPPWAFFFDERAYSTFTTIVDAASSRLSDGERAELARLCRDRSESEWRAIVRAALFSEPTLHMADAQEVLGQAHVDPALADATIADVSPFELEPDDTRDLEAPRVPATPEPLAEKPVVLEPEPQQGPIQPDPAVNGIRTDSVSIDGPVVGDEPVERRGKRPRGWFVLPLAGLALVALVLSLLREDAPRSPDAMLLESPTPGAILVGENGRVLGEPPLPMVSPKGDAVVYIAAAGHRPERLVLPSTGTLRFTLAPAGGTPCTAPIPDRVKVEPIASSDAEVNGRVVALRGAALVRVEGANGSRAQLLRCGDLQPIVP